MDIKALAQQYEPYMIERRRYYHMHPECTYEEVETCAQMKKDLEAIGITDITMSTKEKCHGFVARLHGGKPGRTVGLRSDIDALPVKEETGLPFASVNEGKMHACGHDNHMAMLLGAAKILYDMKDELCGDVLFIVQPAEEFATGALDMVEQGLVDGVDAFYGAHVWGDFESGCYDATPGNRMACCHHFGITVEGMSSHGSAPHLGNDAVVVMTAILNGIQTMVSRWNDPLNPLVVTVGKIDAGNRWNVVAGKAEMEGTIRTFLDNDKAEKKLCQLVEGIAAAYGAKAFVHDYLYMTVPVINDPHLAEIAQNACKKLYGEEMLKSHAPMMGSEDFSWYGKTGAPYFFGYIGTKNPEKGLVYANHHEKYDVEEYVLQKGAAIMAQFAVDFLAE